MNKKILTFILLLISPFALADDVEIYTGKTTNVSDPNVVFIFDTSGSMSGNYTTGQDGSRVTRLQASKDAAINIISGLSDINISVMEFQTGEHNRSPLRNYGVYRSPDPDGSPVYSDYGGLISVPMGSINDDDHKSRLISTIDNLPGDSYTPLLESYEEAARYLRGDDVMYGKLYGYIDCEDKEKTIKVDGYYTQKQVCVEYRTEKTCKEYGSVWVSYGWWGWWETRCIDWETTETDRCDRWGWVDDEWVEGYEYTDYVKECSGTSSPQYFYMSDTNSLDDTTGKYISPINDTCQSNHIVVFTDGESYEDDESDVRINEQLGSLPTSTWSGKKGISRDCETTNPIGTGRITKYNSDSCLEEAALYYYETDNIADSKLKFDDNTGVESVQRIITHTIGGFLNSSTDGGKAATERLELMAKYGGDGVAGTAQNYDELVTQLRNLFSEISSTAGSFSAPSVAVNALNRLENSDELYFALFEPNIAKGWTGNLKRYKLGSGGDILDANGNLAVDSSTGFFSEGSTSFWTQGTSIPDGDIVNKGGFASRLEDNRKVITHIGSSSGTIDDYLLTGTPGSFTIPGNITQGLFNTTMTDEEFTSMLAWANGLKVSDSGSWVYRHSIEDPLHSRPVILHYGVLDDGESLDSTVYFGTNSGFLHAVDSNVDNPRERFAYIPQELLPNVFEYYENGTQLGKVYGLDGPISYYLAKDEGDRLIINSGDQAILYVGMRRGGKSYYAIDVSDRDKPKFLWQINGGSGDFAELGQTWSKMLPITMDPASLGLSASDESIKVLVFGGGYDADEDNTSTRITHDQGNAIFIVNALTGELLWKASANSSADLRLTGMTSSITSDITPVDNDGDGNIDLLYAADMGGRIWRIDFHDDGTQSGIILADLNGGTSATNTRFYTSPDVSYMSGRYVVGIGSGYRSHPLDETVDDNYYVIYDYMTSENSDELKAELATYVTKDRDDLADYNAFSSASDEQAYNGFYFALMGTGEKSLTNSITIDGSIYFTTYKPADINNQTSCSGNTGEGKLYILTLKFGEGSTDDSDSECTDCPTDRERPSQPNVEIPDINIASGIPPEPEVAYTTIDKEDDSATGPDPEREDCTGTKTLLVGSASFELDSCITLNKNYWHEVE